MLQLQYGRIVSEHYYTAKTMLEAHTENRTVPLTVNCCGRVVRVLEFTTDVPAGRRDYYLMYMLHGTLSARFGQTDGVLHPGSFVCIQPGSSYRYSNDGDNEIHYLTMHFTGYEADTLLQQAGIQTNTVYQAGIHAKIAELYESMFSLFRNPSEYFSFAIAAHIQFILFALTQAVREHDNPQRHMLEASISYIHTHLDEEISVEFLGEMEHLSPSRYRAVFHAVTGCAPRDYITRQRIQQACSLLAETGLEIREIAERSGYRDRLYFQRIFKKQTGLTPAQYRKKA